MRTLSQTLLNAQKSPSHQPYVKVEVLDKLASVVRPKLTRLYTGAEQESHHAVVMAGDGSLIRARVHPTSAYLYIQRITNPGPSSDFSSWTNLGDASRNVNIVLCSSGAKVMMFYIEAGSNTQIIFRESFDYGASWSSGQPVLNPAINAVEALAAGIASDGVVALFYASDAGLVYVTERTGPWGNSASWSNNASSITGMACVYDGDWNLVVTGQDSNNDFKVWTCIYGDGSSQAEGTWSPLMELTSASDRSSVEFHVPFVGKPDVYRMYFTEKYTGTTPYTQINWSHSLASATFDQNLWREPVPFNLSPDYGVALAYGGGYLWLSTPQWSLERLPIRFPR